MPPILETRVRLTFEKLGCGSCVAAIRGAAEALPGVIGVEPDPNGRAVVVAFEPDVTPQEAIEEAVRAAGYPVVASEALP